MMQRTHTPAAAYIQWPGSLPWATGLGNTRTTRHNLADGVKVVPPRRRVCLLAGDGSLQPVLELQQDALSVQWLSGYALLAACGNAVHVWDGEAGHCCFEGEGITCVAAAPDTPLLAVGTAEPKVCAPQGGQRTGMLNRALCARRRCLVASLQLLLESSKAKHEACSCRLSTEPALCARTSGGCINISLAASASSFSIGAGEICERRCTLWTCVSSWTRMAGARMRRRRACTP